MASGNCISVLVVEDEFLIRMDVVDSLERAGFIVFEAGTAREALEILSVKTDINAVFTDIDMPGGMDGLKLAALVRDRWPPLKVIITSGYRKIDSIDLPSECRFFAKPYNPERVITTIREMVSH